MPAQPLFGLDIGVTSIKAVQFINTGKAKRLSALGTIPTPVGGFLGGEEASISTVAETIKKLVKDSKISTKNANIALPESKIFTRVMEMPPISDEELTSAITWEAEQYIPMALEDVNMDWQVLSRPKEPGSNQKMSVLLSASPKKLIESYMKLADKSDLNLVSLEPETIAVVRSFSLMGVPSPTSLVLEMGAEETNLIIIKDGYMLFTRTIGTGGNALTRAIGSQFGLEFIQAEEYKKTYGLEKESFDGKLAEVLKPLVDILVTEIKRGISFYESTRTDDSVKRLILSGSPTLMPGMVRYLTEAVGVETQLADPWDQQVEIDSKLFPDIQSKGPSFALACGLAKKELDG